MLVKSLALGSAAVSASHFRAVSMSIVNGPSENDVTILRTMAWQWGSGELQEKNHFFRLVNPGAGGGIPFDSKALLS